MWRWVVSQRDSQDTLGETHLPHHVKSRRLQDVATKVTIEICVSLEQRDGDAPVGPTQGQDRAGRHTPIILNAWKALPEFPLETDAARARQFVAAWHERNNIQDSRAASTSNSARSDQTVQPPPERG